MLQMKFNFNNFIFYSMSVTAWQRASGIRRRRWRLWLAYPIITSFPLLCVCCVGWKPCLSRKVKSPNELTDPSHLCIEASWTKTASSR